MADRTTSAMDDAQYRTPRERIIARYGWPIPRMAGAEEPGATTEPAREPAGEPRGEPASTTRTTPADPDAQLLEGARNPDAVARALRAERATAAAEKKRADDLAAEVQKYKDRDLSTQERLEARAARAEQDSAAHAVRLLRYEVAAAKGLPLRHAHRIQGATKVEMEADAAELVASLVVERERPDFDGGARRPARPTDMNQLIRRAAGRT